MWIFTSRVQRCFLTDMQLFFVPASVFSLWCFFFLFAANITQRDDVITCVQRDMAEDWSLSFCSNCHCRHFRGIQTGSCKQRSDVSVVAAVPCMFGTGLLQTAGGRLLLSSFHKRDRNLPKPKPIHISQQLVMFSIICVSHWQTSRSTRCEGQSVYLLYFFYSLELHSPFVLREKEGRC